MNKKQKQILEDLYIYAEGEKTTNPFTGRSCFLEPKALSLYDFIKGAELTGDPLFTEAITLFRELYPDEYMILLD